MRLYGEIKTGALDHLSSKVMGYTADRHDRKLSSSSGDEASAKSGDKVRVWDEKRGAYFLRDA
mgnify:CR=1 FL=1